MTYRPSKECISLVAKIAFAVVIVFSAGPDLGSIDADHDGSPEVPVIVVQSKSAAEYQQIPRLRPTTASMGTAPGLPTALTEDLGHIDRALLSKRRLSLALFALSLRC